MLNLDGYDAVLAAGGLRALARARDDDLRRVAGIGAARAAQILAAEAQKQEQILEAEGRKEAAFRDAEARERLAEAEARATMMVSQAIEKGDIQAVNYFVATKYIEALARIATSPNEKLVLMPLEAGNIIGALGGITELTKKITAPKAPA